MIRSAREEGLLICIPLCTARRRYLEFGCINTPHILALEMIDLGFGIQANSVMAFVF